MEQDEKKYVVIGEWEEDGKIEWDRLSGNDFLTKEEAEKIRRKGRNAWENLPEHIPHREYILTLDEYDKKLKEEGIED